MTEGPAASYRCLALLVRVVEPRQRHLRRESGQCGREGASGEEEGSWRTGREGRERSWETVREEREREKQEGS